MAHLIFFATALVFGSNFILMKLGTDAFSPVAVALARVGGGALMLLAVMAWQRRWPRLTRREWFWTAIAGVLGNAGPFIVQPWLLNVGVDHSFLAMFVPATPLLTILVGMPLLGVKPTARQLLGVLGGLALLVALSFEGGEHGSSWLLGVVALSIPLSYATGNTLIRRELSRIDPLPLTALMLLMSAVVVLPFMAIPSIGGIYSSRWTGDPLTLTKAIWALLFLGPIGTGIAIMWFVKLVHDRGPLFAGMVTYMVPPIALFWGWLDSEAITPWQLVAVLGILAMVALVQYNPASRRAKLIESQPVAIVD